MASTVTLQSLSTNYGDIGGGFTIGLNGIFSQLTSYGTQIQISTGITINDSYIISSLGTSTDDDWHAIGVPADVTPVVGYIFTATAVGAGSGNGGIQHIFPTPYQVFFDSTEATIVTAVSNNLITCVVPAHTQGTISVTVTNLSNGDTAILPVAFSYLNPGSTTLGQMRLQAQQMADMVNSQFVTDFEWNLYLNQSWKELYDIITTKFSEDYYVACPATYTTDNCTQLYPLPTDFYKLLGAEIQLNTGNPQSWVTMKNFNFIDRNRWSYPNVYTFYGITNLRYRLVGNQLMIVPQPQSGQTLRLWYNPKPCNLVNDVDILEGVSGWEEYVIIDACIKAWNKQESDPSVFMQQKAYLLARIDASAANRDAGEASHVSDSKSLNYGWGSGSDFNGNGG